MAGDWGCSKVFKDQPTTGRWKRGRAQEQARKHGGKSRHTTLGDVGVRRQAYGGMLVPPQSQPQSDALGLLKTWHAASSSHHGSSRNATRLACSGMSLSQSCSCCASLESPALFQYFTRRDSCRCLSQQHDASQAPNMVRIRVGEGLYIRRRCSGC
jgi:hypothetical protein